MTHHILSGSPRSLLVVLMALLFAGISVVAIGWQARSGSASDPDAGVANAIDAGQTAGDESAAIVDGVPIPESSVARMMALAGTYPPPEGVDLTDRGSVLDMLIDLELLHQEATRRGLVPNDEAVIQFAAEQSETSKAMAESDPAIAALLDGWAKLGHPVGGWSSDPVMLDGYRRAMAVGMLTRSYAEQYGDEPDAQRKTEQDMDTLKTDLRATAEVVIIRK